MSMFRNEAFFEDLAFSICVRNDVVRYSCFHALVAVHSLGEVHAGKSLIRDVSKNVLSALGAVDEHGVLLSLYI